MNGDAHGDSPALEACVDGAQSANESDIDCGTVCDGKCDVGQRCLVDSDCIYGRCQSGECAAGRPWLILGTLAYFDDVDLEAGRWVSAYGDASATILSAVGEAAGPRGPDDRALAFPSSSAEIGTGYAWMPSAPEWALVEGSVDLWFWTPLGALPDSKELDRWGLFGREAGGVASPGQIALGLWRQDDALKLWFRQQEGPGHTGKIHSYISCLSPTVTTGVWHHAAVNFGADLPTQIYLDGDQLTLQDQDCSGAYELPGYTEEARATFGMENTTEPWTFGELGSSTASGSHLTAGYQDRVFHNGRIARLRITAQRQDFARIYEREAAFILP